jgi:alpha/beta superfamily hydrolase
MDLALDHHQPDGAWAGAVLLHPHPDYGGNRFNNVVTALFEQLPAAGVAAVRFDFQSSDTETGAAHATAALDGLSRALGLVAMIGYSFGALVATRVLDPRVAAWILVAPPLAGVPVGALVDDPRPKLVLAADDDQFCPPATTAEAVSGWMSTELVHIPRADHFLVGHTQPVVDATVAFLRRLGEP